MPNEYLLTLDVDEFTQKISALEVQYQSFGSAISTATTALTEKITQLENKLTAVAGTMQTINTVAASVNQNLLDNISKISEKFNDLAGSSAAINKELSFLLVNAKGSLKGVGSPDDNVQDIMPGGHPSVTLPVGGTGSAKDLEKLQAKLAEVTASVKKAEDQTTKLNKAFKSLGDKVIKEVKSVKQKVGGLLSQGTMGVVGGGIGGGIIASLLLGVKEKFRKEQWEGEVRNALEPTGQLMTAQGKKAAEWLNKFQEHAHYYYGISKDQIQGVVRDLAQMGFNVRDIAGNTAKSIKNIRSNVVTLTLALDSHFELQKGASMQKVVQIVTDYGDSLGKASSKYEKIMFAAQKSGMGINRFTDAVFASSQALGQYGIDIEHVAGTMQKLHRFYKDMGLDEKFAGTQAGAAMTGLVGGVTGLSGAMEAIIAQKVFPGKSSIYEAINSLREGWADKEGSMWPRIMRAMYEVVREQAGSDPESMKYYALESGLVTTQQAAKTLVELGQKGFGVGEMDEGTKAQLNDFKKSFVTEGEKLSELQKLQKDLVDYLAKIGDGILQILSGIFGTVVMFFKSIPALLYAMSQKPEKRNEILSAIGDVMDEQLNVMSSGFSGVWENIKAVEKLARIKSIVGTSTGLDNLKRLQEVDFSKFIPTVDDKDVGIAESAALGAARGILPGSSAMAGEENMVRSVRTATSALGGLWDWMTTDKSAEDAFEPYREENRRLLKGTLARGLGLKMAKDLSVKLDLKLSAEQLIEAYDKARANIHK